MTDWTEIEQARARAHAKHGENSIEGITADDPRWLSILAEEGGEASEATLLAWNALLQARLGRVAHEQTYDATGSLRGELVDVLAVASAWLDALDGAPPAPRIEDMAPGTTFTASYGRDLSATTRWMRCTGPSRCVNVGGVRFNADAIDPSTIRDVTPPKGDDRG